jgi:hypothetical protein
VAPEHAGHGRIDPNHVSIQVEDRRAHRRVLPAGTQLGFACAKRSFRTTATHDHPVHRERENHEDHKAPVAEGDRRQGAEDHEVTNGS